MYVKHQARSSIVIRQETRRYRDNVTTAAEGAGRGVVRRNVGRVAANHRPYRHRAPTRQGFRSQNTHTCTSKLQGQDGELNVEQQDFYRSPLKKIGGKLHTDKQAASGYTIHNTDNRIATLLLLTRMTSVPAPIRPPTTCEQNETESKSICGNTLYEHTAGLHNTKR